MKLLSFLAGALLAATSVDAFAAITPGSKIPSLDLDSGFPPNKVNMEEYTKGRKVFVVGLPGAFTPTWSSRQVPGYLESQDAIKEAGIDEIIVFCVNDGAVMTAWAKDQGTEESMISMFGDPTGAFTKAVGMELTADGPIGKGLIGRSKRFAMLVDDGEIKDLAIAESEFDPAGDDFPEKTLAPALLEMLQTA